VFGIYPASKDVIKNEIGTRWSNVDLVAAGHSITVIFAQHFSSYDLILFVACSGRRSLHSSAVADIQVLPEGPHDANAVRHCGCGDYWNWQKYCGKLLTLPCFGSPKD